MVAKVRHVFSGQSEGRSKSTFHQFHINMIWQSKGNWFKQILISRPKICHGIFLNLVSGLNGLIPFLSKIISFQIETNNYLDSPFYI